MTEEDRSFNIYWILCWVIPVILILTVKIAKTFIMFYFAWLFQLAGALYILFCKKIYIRHWLSKRERIFFGIQQLIIATGLLLCTIDVFRKFGWS